VAKNGGEAMIFLHRNGEHTQTPRPYVILLDLSLPKKDSRKVLVEIKSDDELKLLYGGKK
jgi:chemotaxis family two-component system response regulator Rcp1